jgi:hypothetical protein
MKSKFSLILLVLALLLLMVPMTAAQDETFGLSADDFALLNSQNFDGSSVSGNLSLTLQVSGAPEEEVSANITGSGIVSMDAAGQPTGQITVTGTTTEAGTTKTVNLELRAIDGVLYVNDQGTDATTNGWEGTPLEAMMGPLEAMIDPAAMAGDPAAMGDMASMMGDMEASEFVQIARLEDMNGQAHFQITFDIQAFLNSESFGSLIGMAAAMSGDEQAQAMASTEGMGQMFAFMFQDTSFTIDEFISPADGRVQGMTINFGLTVDPSMFGEPDATPITVNLSLSLSDLQYDLPVEVVAPEGAVMTEG